MRLIACASPVLAALALAGCGGNDKRPTWKGPPEPGPNGEVAVAAFDDYMENVDEPWEGSAAMAATEFLRLDERTAARTSVIGSGSAEGGGPETVVVTLDGIPDDSILAERWTLGFTPAGDVYRLEQVRWAQRCRPGRGHQSFTPRPCI